MADDYLEAVDALVAAARAAIEVLDALALDGTQSAAANALRRALAPLEMAEEAVPLRKETP